MKYESSEAKYARIKTILTIMSALSLTILRWIQDKSLPLQRMLVLQTMLNLQEVIIDEWGDDMAQKGAMSMT